MNNKTWCGMHSIDDLSINLPLDCKIKDSPNFQCFHVYLQTTDTERKTGGSTWRVIFGNCTIMIWFYAFPSMLTSFTQIPVLLPQSIALYSEGNRAYLLYFCLPLILDCNFFNDYFSVKYRIIELIHTKKCTKYVLNCLLFEFCNWWKDMLKKC